MAHQLIAIPEAAARLDLSTRFVARLVAWGDLPSVLIGRSRRIRSDDLDRFIAQLGSDRKTS